ncbi:MAG: response regulator transcription factor [Anaerolineae bacterium]|jgi:DNA-binding NarL/FixJ family response regulator|nr:response regulator transcription factor [Anaerolineae bacterium]
MTRVLIVDDQDIVRQGLGVILTHAEGVEVAGYAADGQEALEQARALRPDVVLMDLKMPRLNGIQATARLTREQPSVKIVVLTTYDADEWLFDAIRAGASGYLLKDSDSDEIAAAVRGAAAGEVRIDPAVAGRVLQEFNRLKASRPATAQAEDLPRIEELTERELAILQELAQGKSNREIAASLYLAEGTVKNYVSIIIEKLHANDRTHAAILALKRGLATLE